MIVDYVLKFNKEDLFAILNENDFLGYYSLKIDFMKLFETYPDIGDQVLCNPVDTLKQCNIDLIKAQQHIIKDDEYKSQLSKLDNCSLKKNVHARFFGLPVCPELHRTILPKNVDVGCFLKVTGTIVRVTQAKMLEYQRNYICVKCKYENFVEGDFEHRYILKAPTKCLNREKNCKCSTFTPINLVSREYCKDYQEIKIQEQVNKLSIGTLPGSMWVVLEDDLVDKCKPGDDVYICGTLRRRWRPTATNKKCEVELVLQANYLEVCNAQRSVVIANAPDVKDCFDEYWSVFDACPLKGRDQILASVCPQVYGLHIVKLALLLTVITGSNHVNDNESDKSSQEEKQSSRVRGQCHLLLVGDPGTGKSQLLRAGADLTPRSVMTSGAGSTRAGLTCAALREDGEWQLEAGALVLSDGGVCCIDEIGQLREHDRTAIHEAMEQQTISIAKAGIVCKLNTRCAVIAACNPKGHYETDQPLSVNVSLGTPLLSRFDIIFILLDSKNEAWDKLVSSYILFGGTQTTAADNKQWTLEKLQMYISLVGQRTTKMTESANAILQTYYMTQRKSDCRDPSRTTVRMLDSLVRLSQAHCRLMYRDTILPMDAIMAVSLIDLSMQDCTLNDTADALHSTIPKYSDFDYLCTAKKLLTRLNLFEIWKDELLFYAKLLQIDHLTLQSEIEKGSSSLFSKFDDITDENIPLSATLITSSYFNGKRDKKTNLCQQEFIKNDKNKKDVKRKNDNELNAKLAATLKKIGTLNKDNTDPQSSSKKTKRKRKVVTLDTSSISKEKTKKVKKTKAKNITVKNSSSNSDEENYEKNILNAVKNSSSNSDEENYEKIILNAVPSVNDLFSELGIDFKFEDDQENYEVKKTVKIEPEDKIHKNQEIILSKNRHEDSTKATSSTLSKLQQFQYVDKHVSKSNNIEILESEHKNITDSNASEKIDYNAASSTLIKLKEFQFCDKHNRNKSNNKETVKLEIVANNNLSKSSDSLKPCSQISMFESSDCDIDLDL